MKSLSLSQPHVIAMVGIPGSGKSAFAEKFAETFHAPCVSQSRLEYMIGDSAVAKDVMGYQLDELLKAHQSIIVDGGTDARNDRIELARKARQTGYAMLFVWVQIDTPTARLRATRSSKQQTYPPITDEEFDRRLRRFTPPNNGGKPLVISGKHTYASQAKVVLRKLSAPRTHVSGHIQPPIRATEDRDKPAGPSRHNITIG